MPVARSEGLHQPALAGLFPLVEAGQDRRDRRQRRDVVAKARAEHEGIHTLGCGHVGDTGPGPESGDVEARLVGVGTFQAIAGDDGVDEPRVGRLQGLLVEACALQSGGPYVGDEDVGGGGEARQGLASLGLTHVQHHGALAAIVQVEGRITDEFGLQVGEDVAHGIAARPLDLDHVGAPVAQHAGCSGRGDVGGEFDDLQALKQHVAIPRLARLHSKGHFRPCAHPCKKS